MSKNHSAARKEVKRTSAEERNNVYSKLTPKEKIEALDLLFGPGKGAKKQREKLNKLI